MSEWYLYVAKDMSLRDPKILGRNWAPYSSSYGVVGCLRLSAANQTDGDPPVLVADASRAREVSATCVSLKLATRSDPINPAPPVTRNIDTLSSDH
jgi:hypothetical protein